MKNRNPLGVLGLMIITLGIYSIVWFVKTKNEMNSLGANIPTAWLLIVPLVNLWWMWKYSQGVEHVTSGKQSAALAFVLLYFLSGIGSAIIQSDFNKIGQSAAPAGPQPDGAFGAPVVQAPAAPVAPGAPETPAAPVAAAPVEGTPVQVTTPSDPTQPPTQPVV